MKKLAEKYNEYKRIEFPRSPKDDNLETLFTELVQYDEYIAGSIDRILKGDTKYKGKLYKNEQLIKDITEYLNSNYIPENKDIEAAEEYLLYLQRIEGLLNEVWNTGS
jgi:hypothetical protein